MSVDTIYKTYSNSKHDEYNQCGADIRIHAVSSSAKVKKG